MQPLGLVETALRHGQQTLLLSRLRRRHLVPVAELCRPCGFEALDVMSGSPFEACLRFLAEDPFERVRAVRAAIPDTPLLALLRGQALVGHHQYPDDVVDALVAALAQAGIDRFRCYDPLNDVRNLERCVSAVHAAGKQAEGGIVFTESPVHETEGFVAIGRRLQEMGYDALCLSDPVGLLGAASAGGIVRGLVAATGLPVNVHSVALTGQTGFAYLAAAEAGAASVDVTLAPLSGGSSLPPTEAVLAGLQGTPMAPPVDATAVNLASQGLYGVLEHYRDIFDQQAAMIDTSVLRTQLAPAAVAHLLAELRERDAVGKLEAVQAEIPRVRAELGYPPLITPIAQIVATQAVYNVCDGDRYATISQEVKDYCLGLYGEPPGQVNPEVRRVVNGREEPITCRPADLLEPGLTAAQHEMEREGLSIESREMLLCYTLFPVETGAWLRSEVSAERLGDEPSPPPRPVTPASGDSAPTAADQPPPPPADEVRQLTVEVDGESFEVRVTAPAGSFGSGGGAATGAAPGGGRPVVTEGTVVAPMQGVILKIPVAVGDHVTLGATVAVLEAMKMQNDIVATRAGTVQAIHVAEGAVVAPNDPLVQVD